MSKPKILIQLDPDPQPSSFDAVVAVDSGVDHLLQYHSVTLEQVTGLVHGAMFTRGPADLHNTAIFIGGSNVTLAEAMLKKVSETFFGPVRVSVMMDASGANTTAAAAVVTAGKHLDLSATKAVVLAATGPVGQRVVRLLAAAGGDVKVASRSIERAQRLVDQITSNLGETESVGALAPVSTGSSDELTAAIGDTDLVIAAGAAGVELLPASVRKSSNVKVAIDLNAVPPFGIEGIDVMDKLAEQDGQVCYGAIGVGGTKMQIHKAAIRKVFQSSGEILDVDEIFQIGLAIQ